MKKFVKDVLAGFEDAIAHAKSLGAVASVRRRRDKSRGVLTTYTIPDRRSQLLSTRTLAQEVPVVDVKSVRKKTGLTQEAFARLFAIKTRTLQDWEQDRRTPGSMARVFLALIDQHPATVKKTLQSMGYSLVSESKKKYVKGKAKAFRNQAKKIVDPKSLKDRSRKCN